MGQHGDQPHWFTMRIPRLEAAANSAEVRDGARPARMIKQSVDARSVKNQGGYYFGAAAADDPFALGAEVGAFHYFDSIIEGRAGLKGLLGTAQEDWFVGGSAGALVLCQQWFDGWPGLESASPKPRGLPSLRSVQPGHPILQGTLDRA